MSDYQKQVISNIVMSVPLVNTSELIKHVWDEIADLRLNYHLVPSTTPQGNHFLSVCVPSHWWRVVLDEVCARVIITLQGGTCGGRLVANSITPGSESLIIGMIYRTKAGGVWSGCPMGEWSCRACYPGRQHRSTAVVDVLTDALVTHLLDLPYSPESTAPGLPRPSR